MKHSRYRIALLQLLLFLAALTSYAAEGDFPAWYETTTRLNIRAADNTRARKIATVAPGTQLQVDYITTSNWAAIQYQGNRAYVSRRYIRYVRDVEQPKAKEEADKKPSQTKRWIYNIILWTIVFFVIRYVAVRALGIAGVLMYKAYWVLCIPFYILNWLQRHLSKPWRIFYKKNKGSEQKNKELREMYEYIKIPLYIVLTPLRFVNAFYYNMLVHCSFEMYNYVIELFLPSNDNEGADNVFLLVLLLPWRILKYVVWHGGLTLIESAIWTITDTFVPALTLFHGTSEEASLSITHAGRCGYSNSYTGIWNVGSGNYAGNGIYFAPARSTALHYADGALIVCRVSLGRVLDLGLAPYHVFRQCGYPDALGATKWGLANGYVTGEWWRKDQKWWEYCMYDWQNRYNYSWRIRPIHVLNLRDGYMQRIPGGMCHWLFRKMVIEDIITYFEEKFKQ